MIIRDKYLVPLRKSRDKRIIKVITGIRRCGKSTLLQLVQKEVRAESSKNSNIVYINFEDMTFRDLSSPEKLNDYILDKLDESTMNYLFLDEVQFLDGFEKTVNSLFLKDNIDIYLTGSN